MEILAKTSFNTIYDSFTDRITSTLFMEMTELDTFEQLQGILLNAILPGNDYHFGDDPDSDSSRGVDFRPRELEKELQKEYES